MSKKLEILTIAREVIHSKGYKATSISDILNAADIGKGQFYYYFSSKRDLGLAVIDDLVEDWTEQLINSKLHNSENPKENLNAMLD
ncbi:TetR/AcrR family transcriptional regulator, partial [Enterococcus faecalis]